MCLDSVSRNESSPSTLIQDGWKQFSGSVPRLRFAAYEYKGSYDVPLDRWISAEGSTDYMLTSGDLKKYLAGFHIYEFRDEAKKAHATRRVFYRKVTTYGRQDGQPCVIAQEMYVPSDPNGWPPKEHGSPSLVNKIKDSIKGKGSEN